jgi:hypothetical protein
MHPRITELLDYTDRQREHLRRTVDEIPRERHAIAPASGGWTVIGVLEHLAIVETRVTGLLAKKTAELRESGAPAETETSAILPRLNIARFLNRAVRIQAPASIHPPGTSTLDEAWTALDRSRCGFRDAVIAADGLALGTMTAPHVAAGPLDLYSWIAFVGAHEARHADQIREIGASLGEAR